MRSIWRMPACCSTTVMGACTSVSRSMGMTPAQRGLDGDSGLKQQAADELRTHAHWPSTEERQTPLAQLRWLGRREQHEVQERHVQGWSKAKKRQVEAVEVRVLHTGGDHLGLGVGILGQHQAGAITQQ